MSDTQNVSYHVESGVAVITVDNPPVNALAPGMREGIIDGLQRAGADPAVKAVVLIGSGKNFIAGADIRQFGKARRISTSVSTAALDACEKPVIAAMQGYVLGAGLEHALACHYRIATPDAKLGLPEVSIGVIPAGGGTQRLTRLIGPKVAVEMISTGRHVSAFEALKSGIVTQIVSQEKLLASAISYAKDVAPVRPLPRVRDMTDQITHAYQHPEAWEAAKKVALSKARNVKAPNCAVACVEAALTGSFEDGLALEQRLFSELEGSDEARALRYAFFAEREAKKIPGAPESYKPEGVRSAAIVGAGTMGAGIAICFADVLVPVKALDVTQEALDRGMKRIQDT